jgi:hypothetical protein
MFKVCLLFQKCLLGIFENAVSETCRQIVEIYVAFCDCYFVIGVFVQIFFFENACLAFLKKPLLLKLTGTSNLQHSYQDCKLPIRIAKSLTCHVMLECECVHAHLTL